VTPGSNRDGEHDAPFVGSHAGCGLLRIDRHARQAVWKAVEMEVCIWREEGYDRSFVSEPSTSEVTEALRLLDGEERNDLYLRSDSDQWMGFGGGPRQVIVAYSEGEDGPHYQAVRKEALEDEGSVTMRIGGQEVELPVRYMIALDAAIPAALAFVETSGRPEVLAWEPR
jgi:hypothetical protein